MITRDKAEAQVDEHAEGQEHGDNEWNGAPRKQGTVQRDDEGRRSMNPWIETPTSVGYGTFQTEGRARVGRSGANTPNA